MRAIEALGSEAKASIWLRTAHRALPGMVPLSLLETDMGARLHRINPRHPRAAAVTVRGEHPFRFDERLL
jgi:hypothetical protein